MARQERWYYRNDPRYSNEEVARIDKILKKEDAITAIFVPIVAITFMLMIPCLVIDIVFHIKALELAIYILAALFAVEILLWAVFYFKVSQERSKIMMEIEKDKKKSAH